VQKRKKEKTSLSCQELGPLMGVTRQTIRNWIDKGDIRALHNGRKFEIPADEALRILQHYELPVPNWLRNGHPSP
jgi:excisionase family DNA binding protein